MKVKNPFKKIKQAALTEVLKEGTNLIDEIFTSQEEKAEAKQKYFNKIVDDRQDARSMYAKDSILQKVFALFFLIIWAFLLHLLLKHFIFNNLKLEEWQIAFINTIWGGVSMKLGTIIDFLFGGSAKGTN